MSKSSNTKTSFMQSEMQPHPLIAARRGAVRLHRLDGLDIRIRTALRQLKEIMSTEDLFFHGGAYVIGHIEKMVEYLNLSDPRSLCGLEIQFKIAEFLVEQQFYLDIMSARMALNSDLVNISHNLFIDIVNHKFISLKNSNHDILGCPLSMMNGG